MQTSKEDLLQADFEGALKFFRVQLPKRYRAAENARRLMEQACNIKVRNNFKRCSSTNYSNHVAYSDKVCFWSSDRSDFCLTDDEMGGNLRTYVEGVNYVIPGHFNIV